MTTDTVSTSDGCIVQPSQSEAQVTTKEARERLKELLFLSMTTGENTLIDAPTSLGKSFLVATTPWREHPSVTGEKPVIHVHQTKDARDEAVQVSEEHDLEYHVLLGREEACPVAGGEYDEELNAPNGTVPSEWFRKRCDVEKISFRKAHRRLESELGSLPCSTNGRCHAISQWQELSSDDEPAHDIVHVTAPFTHVEELVDGANVIYDERPEFKLDLNRWKRDHLRQATTNLLHSWSDGKFSKDDLKSAVRNEEGRKINEITRLLDDDVTQGWLFSRQDSHRLSPQFARAVASATKVSESRYRGTDGEFTAIFNDQGKDLLLHDKPDLEDARCVIGLDAHPVYHLWEANTVEGLQQRSVLSTEERRWWRRNERGLRVVQIGEATRSHTCGWQSDTEERKAKTIIRWVRQKYGGEFGTAISAKKVKDDVAEMMTNVGIFEPGLMHYGEEKSRNDFEDESVGLLVGCIDPGDDAIQNLLGLCGMDALPTTVTTEDGEESRKPGREFDGPDADVASEFLASVRENHLAQSAGRYARSPDSTDSGATVFVWSAALPDIMTDHVMEVSYNLPTELKRQMCSVVREETKATAREVADKLDADKSYVIDCLNEMVEQNILAKYDGTGYQGADEYEYLSGTLSDSATLSP